MTEQEGKLTATQFEILKLLWDSKAGMTVAEIWNAARNERDVSRTTILNLVDRLEKRNWLRREKLDGVYRYQARVDRDSTESRLATEFVSDFFDGSTSNFVLSLVGSKRVAPKEIKRLRAILDELPDSSHRSKQKGVE